MVWTEKWAQNYHFRAPDTQYYESIFTVTIAASMSTARQNIQTDKHIQKLTYCMLDTEDKYEINKLLDMQPQRPVWNQQGGHLSNTFNEPTHKTKRG